MVLWESITRMMPHCERESKAYELAFHMQMAVPDVVNFNGETDVTRRQYGSGPAGHQTIRANSAWRRGDSSSGACGSCRFTTTAGMPIANCRRTTARVALLSINRSRHCCTISNNAACWTRPWWYGGPNLGRTPGAERSDGRDHHPYGSQSGWRGEASAEASRMEQPTNSAFHAVEHRHYVTDLHATVLHQLGHDPRRLEVPGQKRLEIDFGTPIRKSWA